MTETMTNCQSLHNIREPQLNLFILNIGRIADAKDPSLSTTKIDKRYPLDDLICRVYQETYSDGLITTSSFAG